MRRLPFVSVVVAVLSASLLSTAPTAGAVTVTEVVVSQAGYSAGAYKVAYILTTGPLTDRGFQVNIGSTQVHSGTAVAQGVVWGKYVYVADFSAVAQTGSDLTVTTHGVSSYPFPIAANVWDSYKDEMTAFYRLQRASVATSDAYPPGYSSVEPSAKAFHAAGHLDDAASADGTEHYDLTGGWYDAGDYGKYGGNQWVTGQIALSYLRHAGSPSLQFDNDGNGVPDLVDEARWGAEYLLRFADQLGGQMYDLPNNAGFKHPEFATDNISGTADDRRLKNLGVGGSAKAAGALAATARAAERALADGNVRTDRVADLTSFAAACRSAAVTFYDYAAANPDAPLGSYATRGGLPNSLLLAEVELYLLTGEPAYKTSATSRINTLTFNDLYSTNYWDLRPLAMAEFHPVADATTQAHIHNLLKQQVDYAISMADDTPYGVVNMFSNFGVNEPQASYLGDLVRFYEVFGDPRALRAALRGTYWLFGNNPWNLSWVSGIGADHVDFLHTRLDEESYSTANTGIVIPGALVSGPNVKDTKDVLSVSPWYADRSLWQDDVQQWRYNEYSVSIQVGLLYTVMALTDINDASSSGGFYPARFPVTSPVIGDYVTGDVTVFAGPAAAVTGASLGDQPMTYDSSTGVWSGVTNVDALPPYTTKRLTVRGVLSGGLSTHSATHITVAPPLPDPSHPLLYDDFSGGGTWGQQKLGWVNWYNQAGGAGTFSRVVVEGRDVGKFTQTPASSSSWAKFEPWKDQGNFSGYRYLALTMANPSHPNLRYKLSLNDGTSTCSLTGGFTTVASTWTPHKLDMDLCAAIDRGRAHLELWLQQTDGSYGEMFIDDVRATNDPSGTAPAVTGASVGTTAGDTTTPFEFTATYTDADDTPPHAIQVVIDGVIRPMEAVDPADTTYRDGKQYRYVTLLPQGVHSYYVRATDTTSDAVRTPTATGPTVT